MRKAISITVAAIVLVAAAGYFLTVGGGKPISADLSVVGQGKPSLVLAYENYSPTGGEALNRLRRVRSDFDTRIAFAVADLGTPEGRAFASRHQLVDGQAVFLDEAGQPLVVTFIAENEQDLRNRLQAKLAAVGQD